ncbi:Shedu anti-phage system protein SduA domain-containing protein [Cryobacterium sp. N19]|uniref:Shedu anti-phage system protein SduA domain-containing protein n=1 Tax=Cryobacterium sp. N19 TaxID=2048288 RepID=UPI000CE33927|nr:Shedu anti-phage system protein SduA domain-containing protein [Cryobacterium sp. N19]
MPSLPSPQPLWSQIADSLDAMIAGPTPDQVRVAGALGIPLSRDLPAPVAAVVIRDSLKSVLFQGVGGEGDLPEALTDLEDSLNISPSAHLITGSRAEVSAWFSARYMVMTSRGLRALRPEPGDVVSGQSGAMGNRVISTISDDGHINLKGRPTARVWPNHLVSIARVGTPEHSEAVSQVDAQLRNAANYASASFGHFSPLTEYALENYIPAPEAIRALEELLESGERLEQPFQNLLALYPSLLSSIVIGNWKTFVIPQPRLGAEHVPDFLVLGFNSLGPHWVTVEIEAARHKILNQSGRLSGPTNHAVQQIQDWREWLTDHVAYAQTEHHFHGLTNRAPGLVIIGRDTPSPIRQAARAQSEEDARIAIHSWDWLLRNARARAQNPLTPSDFALKNLANHSTLNPSKSPSIRSTPDEVMDDEFEELEIDDLLSG